MSKLFTTIVAMQLVDRGKLSLDATVASYLPHFAQNGKGGITIRQLLTHTSGMPPDPTPRAVDVLDPSADGGRY